MIAGRVVMLSRDQGLASIAGQLVGRGQPLTRFSSPTDVPDWLRPPTGVVVLDYPKPERVIVYRQLRQRYLGPVLALLDPDESSSGLPVDQARIGILHRPFNGGELSASLDALVGSPNIARRTKSRALTAPPVGANAVAAAGLEHGAELEATAAFAAPAALAPTPARAAIPARPGVTPAAGAAPAKALWPRANRHRAAGVPGPVPLRLPAAARFATAAGIPAAKVAQRRVAEAARRGLALRHPGPTARRRLNSLALVLAATSALVLGATLSDGRGCPSTGCGKIAGAAESGGVIAPGGPPTATPQMGAQPAQGHGQQAAPRASDDPAPAQQPAAGMIIGLASGVDDLLRGTSSSSGGAPLLMVTSGPTPPASGGAGGSDGGSGGGVPVPATQPPATSPPVTTAPPTTTAPPATTAPPVTDPPTTTEPPPTTTEPPPTTTEPPPTTTEPPPTTTEAPTTTEPATTATTSATSETSPPSSTSLA